jgi:putative ribosome biogenesis GTPase RsgA
MFYRYASLKTTVLRELKQTCSRKNLQKPKSVLLVGPAGVGKSSFINSSITAMTGRYSPYAKSGCGENVTAENNV